jgi:hypothetical protein
LDDEPGRVPRVARPVEQATGPPIECPNTIGLSIPAVSQKTRTSLAHVSKLHPAASPQADLPCPRRSR